MSRFSFTRWRSWFVAWLWPLGALPIWFAGVIVGWRHLGMRRTFGFRVIAFVADWALVYSMVVWDPGGFVEWFNDCSRCEFALC